MYFGLRCSDALWANLGVILARCFYLFSPLSCFNYRIRSNFYITLFIFTKKKANGRLVTFCVIVTLTWSSYFVEKWHKLKNILITICIRMILVITANKFDTLSTNNLPTINDDIQFRVWQVVVCCSRAIDALNHPAEVKPVKKEVT